MGWAVAGVATAARGRRHGRLPCILRSFISTAFIMSRISYRKYTVPQSAEGPSCAQRLFYLHRLARCACLWWIWSCTKYPQVFYQHRFHKVTYDLSNINKPFLLLHICNRFRIVQICMHAFATCHLYSFASTLFVLLLKI